MSFTIASGQDIDRDAWNDFVSRVPDGNAFQSPRMFDFFLTVERYRPCALACLDQGKEIQGVLVAVVQRENEGAFGRFSSRAVVWGGPVLNHGPEANAVLQALLSGLVERIGRETIFIEFRNLFDLDCYVDQFHRHGFEFHEHLNFRVPTMDAEAVRSNLNAGKKRQIRKGLASGAEIVEAESIDQVEEFYWILRDLFKKKVGKPLPGWSFFRNFFQAGRELGVYLLIRFKGRVIGGIMCPRFGNRAIYEWYVCGQDNEFPEQYPSVLATWAAIDHALRNRIQFFDFMGAGEPGKDYGVREFKARFGGELLNHGRFLRINDRFMYSLGKAGLKFLGRAGSL